MRYRPGSMVEDGARPDPPSAATGATKGSKALWPPLSIWLPAATVALLMGLPLAYLLLRAVGAVEAFTFLLRPRTFEIVGNSVALTAVVTILSIFIAVPLAWLQVRTDLPGRATWSVLTSLPLVVPSYVMAYTIIGALGPRGLLQEGLATVLPVQRLPEIYGFWGAALALTACAYPYVLLSVRAALRGMDPSTEEAARGLGGGRWRVFATITVPLLRPAIGAGALLVALYVLSDFGAVSLLRFDTFTRAIYLQYQASFDRALAAVLALVLVALTAAIMGGEAWTRGRARFARGGAGVARRSRRVPLGRWRWPALLLHVVVAGLTLVLPVAVVVGWMVRGLLAAERFRFPWNSLLGSLLASSVTALVVVLAALPIAILVVRYPGALARAVEWLAYAGYALPGIVIALALVFFGANYVPWAYQTLPMLVAGYAIRFLPQAIGAARAALLQISPRVEEAARSLGRSPGGVAWSVTVPLARGGIMAGAALVFMTTMKELPVTLLLSPLGYETLAVDIWDATSSARFSAAAPAALVLILVAAGPMFLLNRGDDRWDA